ncbi:MAG: hypothetical protein K0R54_2085 [Clostridiaceae bacterium]|jgi:hypothetical protein|nr:hypothetical protein [Clostridiaceae bacterium]
MLEVKKDRVKEIDKQLRKIRSNKKLKDKDYLFTGFSIANLINEKKTLLQEIKDIESKRGE